MRAILASTLLALASPIALAQSTDVLGMVPGQSPSSAVAGAARAIMAWPVAVPEGISISDALGNDCSPPSGAAPGWTCSAILQATPEAGPPDPSSIAIEASFEHDSPSRKMSERRLASALGTFAWPQPSSTGWTRFMAGRPIPAAAGSISKPKAMPAFAKHPEAALAASQAASFQAARWTFRNPSGERCELAALGAFDRKGALVALALEGTLATWGGKLRAAAAPLSPMP